MSSILNIIPKTGNDNSRLLEHTNMYKEEILESLGLKIDNSILSQIKKSLLYYFKK